jgi:hypothetical protein
VKSAQWPDALLASRRRYAGWWTRRVGGLKLGPWHTTDRKDAFDPRKPADLGGSSGKGRKLWQRRVDLADGVVHHDLSNHGINQLRSLPGPVRPAPLPRADGRGPAYLFRVRGIEAEKASTVTVWLGAQHGLEVWLNGKRVFSRPDLGNSLYPQADQARAFCRWLSNRTGLTATLPTEAQWEYACRAGTASPLHYGDVDADFSPFANVADATIGKWAFYNETRRSADQVPRDARYNDGALVTADVGRYQPNAWGLHDMHGNAWEWTRSAYRPYPYRPRDGRNDLSGPPRRAVRGGSWYDRPKRCRSAFRLSYPPWRKVYNVGFRIAVAQ